MTRRRPARVREQLQVYLDPPDRALLEELAKATGLPRTEVFRRGLRSLAQQTLGERAPGWSLDRLVGALGDGSDVPADLAARHDAYLYAPPQTRRAKPRPR